MASQKTSHPSFFSLQFDFSDIFQCIYAYFISCIKWLESFFQTTYIEYNCQFQGIVLSAILPKQGVSYSIVSANQPVETTGSALWRAGNIRSANHGKKFDGCSNYLGIYVTKIEQQTIPSTVNFILVFQLRSQEGSRCYPSFNSLLPGAANCCVTWKI